MSDIDPLAASELVQLQEDITMGLLSWDALDRINVVQMRKLRLQSEVDASAIYATPRNGRAGCGILVEMPTIIVEHTSAPGPAEILAISLAILEEPNLNLEPASGTLMDAETVGRLARRFLHQWFIQDKGELYSMKAAMVPAEEWPGLVAYRVAAGIQLIDATWNRVPLPAIAAEDLTVTLTNAAATPDADIFYTLDNSFPGLGNPGALRYSETGAFAVEDGTIVRWAAYQAGWMPSGVDRATINS